MNGMDSISPQVFMDRYMDPCIVGRVREGSRTLSGFNAAPGGLLARARSSAERVIRTAVGRQ